MESTVTLSHLLFHRFRNSKWRFYGDEQRHVGMIPCLYRWHVLYSRVDTLAVLVCVTQ